MKRLIHWSIIYRIDAKKTPSNEGFSDESEMFAVGLFPKYASLANSFSTSLAVSKRVFVKLYEESGS